MKRFARMLWAAGVLGGLLTGVQTLTAAPPTNADYGCWVCYDMGDGTRLCYGTECLEA